MAATSDSGEQQAVGSEELAALWRRNAELEVLYDTIRDVSSTLSVRQLLERLLKRSLDHLEAEIGSILLLGADGRLRMHVAHGLPDEVVKSTQMELGEGISGHVAETARPLIVDDVENHPVFRRRNHERYYTSSLLSAPLVRGGAVLGVLNVNNKSSRTAFDAGDLRLLEAIAGHASIALSNARKYEETLRRTQLDALTGLANHGHFFATLDREIARADRYSRELSLAMIDIDRFKQYNDSHGHRGGDDALVAVAKAIDDRARMHDVVARYGGEEFAVILPETPLEGALAFGEKIRSGVEGLEGEGDPLTVSVGVAVRRPGVESPNELVDAADTQLYRAKALGRNRVCALDPKHHDAA